MLVTINTQSYELPDGATLADALAQLQPQPPFATAINTQFVPRSQYGSRTLQADDRIEVIAPVTGG